MSLAEQTNPNYVADTVVEPNQGRSSNTTYEGIERPPPERIALLDAIQILKSYEHDWDGNNSLPPHPQALETAEYFAKKVPFQRIFPDAIYPGTDRSLVLKWSNIDEESSTILFTIEPYFIGAVKIKTDDSVEDLGDYALLPDSVFSQGLLAIIPST